MRFVPVPFAELASASLLRVLVASDKFLHVIVTDA